MNRAELTAAVAQRTNTTKADAEAAVGAVFQIISDALAGGGKVRIDDFGTFEVKDRAPRTGRNPKAGVFVKIPACRAPVFKAHKTLKNSVENNRQKEDAI